MGRQATSLARGRLRALCSSGLDADALRRALRARLHALLPFDAYCVNTADPETLAITSSVGDGLSADEASRLFAIEAAGNDVNPLRALARAHPHVAAIGREPERSERMRALFLPRGWVDELRAALVERDRCWGYLHLFRSTPFTRAELRLVARLVTEIGGALRMAHREPVDARAELVPGVIVVGPGGRVLARTRAGEGALSSLPRDAAHDGAPHAVVEAASRAIASGGSAESHVATAHGLLRVVATVEEDCAVVVVDRARSRDVTRLLLAVHRLSPREEEVCRAMLRGLSDDEIATSLGVGTHTVKAHAKALFAKLEVAGRGGLLAKVDLAG